MARQMKKKESSIEVENAKKVVEKVVEEKKEPVKKVKKFNDDDMIPCKSIAFGQVFMEGKKSHDLYEFQYQGDEVDVEYRDLAAAVRANSGFLFTPYIIVQDEDFVNEFPKLKEFYNENYCVDDPVKLLDLNPVELEEILNVIPVGVAEALKNIASSKISKNELDSMAKIKILDSFFGTQLMLMADLYD